VKLLRYTYTAYAGIIFFLTGLFFLTLLIAGSLKKEWHHTILRLNYYWAHFYMWVVGLPPKMVWHYRPSRKKQYIICANHFSYFDIPVMALLPIPFKFIGKNSIAKLPLFGIMFRRLHIMVNRSSLKSRAISMKQAKDAVTDGFNMVFFPEGGVKSTNIPHMAPFRDDAFRLAIEQNIPILPVTLPYDHLILPDDGQFRLRHHRLKLIVHPPIYPTGKDDAAFIELKKKVFDTIQAELYAHHPNSK